MVMTGCVSSTMKEDHQEALVRGELQLILFEFQLTRDALTTCLHTANACLCSHEDVAPVHSHLDSRENDHHVNHRRIQNKTEQCQLRRKYEQKHNRKYETNQTFSPAKIMFLDKLLQYIHASFISKKRRFKMLNVQQYAATLRSKYQAPQCLTFYTKPRATLFHRQ
jgi:hypothetical protein